MRAKLPLFVFLIGIVMVLGLVVYFAWPRPAQQSVPAPANEERIPLPTDSTTSDLVPSLEDPEASPEQSLTAEPTPHRELSESPQAGWTLFGQVRLRNGTPQSGSIKLWLDSGEEVETTLSGDGFYEVELPPKKVGALDVILASFRVPFRGSSKLPMRPGPSVVDRRVRFDVVLEVPCEVHGVVLEAPSEMPISGVPVRLRMKFPAGDLSFASSSLAFSKSDGSFCLQLSAVGPAILEVWPVLPTRPSVELGILGAIRRETRTRDGIPEDLARDEILLRPRPRDSSRERWPLQEECSVDLMEGGSINVGRLFVGALGTVVISADDPWHDDRPVAGERVALRCPVTRAFVLSDPTDGTGITSLEFPPGRHRLYVSGPWTAIEPEEIDLAPGGSVRVRVHRSQQSDFFARLRKSVRIHVSTPQHFPLIDAMVSLAGQEHQTSIDGDATFSCDSDGLKGELHITHGAIRPLVKKDFHADAGSYHDLKIETWERLRLRVLDVHSEAVRKVNLTWIMRMPDPSSRVLTRTAFTSEAKDGVHGIDLPSFERSDVGLFARADQGIGILWLGSGELASREETLVLDTPIEMSGIVVDELGSPVTNATVTISLSGFYASAQAAYAPINQVRTETNGNFKVRVPKSGGTVLVLTSDHSSLCKEFTRVDELLQLTVSPPLRVSVLRPSEISGPMTSTLRLQDEAFEFQLHQKWSKEMQTWLINLPCAGTYAFRWWQDPIEIHQEAIEVLRDGQQIQLK